MNYASGQHGQDLEGWMGTRCKVFISYSHEDEKLKDSKVKIGVGYPRAFLSRFLGTIQAHGISKEEIFFDDGALVTEKEWRAAINSALSDCWLLIFLVSPESIQSDFCMKEELPRALRRGVPIITVLLRPSIDWHLVEVHNPLSGRSIKLGEFHSGGLPKDGGNARPVSTWEKEEDAWAKTCADIRDFIKGAGFRPPADVQHDPVHVDAANARSHEASPEPRPEWPRGESAFLDAYLARLIDCFSDQVFRSRLSGLFEHPDHRLPSGVNRALQVDPAKVGESVCKALLQIVNELSRSLQARIIVLPHADCAVVRDCLKAAFGAAARMCLNPTVLDTKGLVSPGDAAACHRLPASEIAGATLAVRSEPHKWWKRPDRIGGAALEDERAIPITVEPGDTQSAGKLLAAALYEATFPKVFHPKAASSSDMDDEAIGRLRGEAEVDALLGAARYFVLPPDHDGALTPELEAWVIKQLSTGVLVRQAGGGTPPLFRYSETTLFALIGRALAILDQPEWNPS
ncbi:toll/interleukin-1 receptor domain-containing protein [Zoogloea sp.]|uniref:toll/interleukin-1 receptor domain-containing protein n=1 Tax=Zoogloea sp. TaxID=49181 RepID=UPI0025E087D0|nr:toll/interleukin-1 receptor domain-containing protein [Zoogloea sp.]